METRAPLRLVIAMELSSRGPRPNRVRRSAGSRRTTKHFVGLFLLATCERHSTEQKVASGRIQKWLEPLFGEHEVSNGRTEGIRGIESVFAVVRLREFERPLQVDLNPHLADIGAALFTPEEAV